jgi:FdhD protein
MTRRFPVDRFSHSFSESTTDLLSVEEPLLVLINDKPYATLMRTPGGDDALVAGFLFSESLITQPADILSLHFAAHPTSQEAHVELPPALAAQVPAARSIYLSSSCGVCGRAAIDDLLDRLAPFPPLPLDPAFLLTLPPKLTAAQQQFPLTGGVHAAALFTPTGDLLDLAEDVGRHNALDKLIGRAFHAGRLPLHHHILVMSSRASFDIIQKAALAGIPAVATLGAASSLAAGLASRAGLALYAFLRPGSVVAIRSNG